MTTATQINWQDYEAHLRNHPENAVYVGTYAKYNNGSIAGAWIDLDECGDENTFFEVCVSLHADEADPEFMFQDHNGGWIGKIANGGEPDWRDIEKFYAFKEAAEKSNWSHSVLIALLSFTDDVDDALRHIEHDSYYGKFWSDEKFAYEYYNEVYAEELEAMPQILRDYISWSNLWFGNLQNYFHCENGHYFRTDF